jgi:hypothetical protein
MSSHRPDRDIAHTAPTLDGVTAKVEGVSAPPGGLLQWPAFEDRAAFEAWITGFEQLARDVKGTDAAAILGVCRDLRTLQASDVPEAARLGYMLGQYHFQVIRPLIEKHVESLPRSPAKLVIGHILDEAPEARFPEIERRIRNHRERGLAGVHIAFVGNDHYLFNGHVLTRASLKTYVSQEKKKRR